MTSAAKSLALTFDGAWEQCGGSEILDILRQAELQVTVFLTGQFIRRYPDFVRRMAEEGHEIGNHTDTHPYLTSKKDGPSRDGITRATLHQELRQAERAFQQVTGQRMSPLWRAPYGHYNGELLGYALQLGYRHVYWTLDTKDWASDSTAANYRTARQIRDFVLCRAMDGDIVLMHLHSLRAVDRPWEVLPELITGLCRKAFELVTVSELFARQAQGLAISPPWHLRVRKLRMVLTDRREELLRSLRARGRRRK